MNLIVFAVYKLMRAKDKKETRSLLFNDAIKLVPVEETQIYIPNDCMSQPFAVHWLNGIIAEKQRYSIRFRCIQLNFLHKNTHSFLVILLFSRSIGCGTDSCPHSAAQTTRLRLFTQLPHPIPLYDKIWKRRLSELMRAIVHVMLKCVSCYRKECDKARFSEQHLWPTSKHDFTQRKNHFTRFHACNKWKTTFECRKHVDCFLKKAIQLSDYSRKVYTNPFNAIFLLLVWAISLTDKHLNWMIQFESGKKCAFLIDFITNSPSMKNKLELAQRNAAYTCTPFLR